jgi:hypothetical protein
LERCKVARFVFCPRADAAIRGFAISFLTARSFAIFEQKSGEQKRAKPCESCQALQNEHLQKSSHNSREMNTYKIIGLKVEQNEHLQKSGSRRTSALILLRSRGIVP